MVIEIVPLDIIFIIFLSVFFIESNGKSRA